MKSEGATMPKRCKQCLREEDGAAIVLYWHNNQERWLCGPCARGENSRAEPVAAMRECKYCRRTDSLGYMPDGDGFTPGEGWVCTRCAREQRDDARAVANWLHARLYDVSRLCLHLAEDGRDLPRRDWLSFDNEPEACP